VNILQIRPTLEVGGASEYLIRLGEGLERRGHNVTVVSGGGDRGDSIRRFATRYYDDVSLAPRVTLGIGVPNLKNLATGAVAVSRIVRRERIDVVNSHHRFAALVGKAASRLTGKPFVSTMHEIRRDSRRLTVLGLGDRVVTYNEMVKGYVVRTYGVELDRVRVIPPGIELPPPLRPERRAELLSELRLDAEAPVIGCIARLVKRKGHIYLLNAMPDVVRAHPSVQLVLVGDGIERPALEEVARELGITQNVRFAGSRDDVTDLIGLFDFTVLPSLQEEFGIVLIESLAQRKPVVATGVGAIRDLIRDNQTGVVVPSQDSDALSTGVRRLLDDPAAARRLGEAGYGMVEQRYSEEAFIENTERLYESLLTNRH